MTTPIQITYAYISNIHPDDIQNDPKVLRQFENNLRNFFLTDKNVAGFLLQTKNRTLFGIVDKLEKEGFTLFRQLFPDSNNSDEYLVVRIIIPKNLTRTQLNKYFEHPTPRVNADPITGRIAFRIKEKNDLYKKYNLFNTEFSPIPYKDFEGAGMGIDDNCLKDHLIHRMSASHPKTGRIARKSIEKYFSEDTSLQTLMNFCTKYKIRLRLYDGFLRNFYDSGIVKKSTRRNITLMIYNNHIYHYTGKHNDFISKKLNEDPNFSKIRVGFKKTDYSKILKFISSDDMKNSFQYYCERDITCKANRYEIDDFSSKEYKTFDMNKCYFNIIFNIADKKEIYPVFSAADLVVKFVKTDKIVHNAIYFISKEKLNSDEFKNRGLNTNVLMGCFTEYLIKINVLTNDDITHVKIASYKGVISNFVKIINEQLVKSNLPTDYTKEFKSLFRVINGIMGKLYQSTKYMSVDCDNPDDATLLNQVNEEMSNPKVKYLMQFNEMRKFPNDSKGTYEYMNNRNLYNWVVDRSNMEMQMYRDKFIKLGYTVGRICTDSLSISNTKDNLNFHPDFNTIENDAKRIFPEGLFKPERVGNHLIVRTDFMDPESIDYKEECLVIEKNTLIITGPPGSGKTYYVQQNYPDIDIKLAPTNVAALNLSNDAKTVYSFFKRFGKCLKPGQTGLIDEFTMLETFHHNYVIRSILQYNYSWVLSGDLNQLGPIKSKKINPNVEPFKSMFKNNIVQVESKFSRNDKELREFREYVLNTCDSKLIKRLVEFDDYEDEVLLDMDNHLVFTNRYKNFLNRKIMHKKGLVFNVYNSKKNNEQFIVSKDIKLICRSPVTGKSIFKSQQFILKTNVNKNSLDFKLESVKTGQSYDLLIKFMNNFEPSYAMTTHSSQCVTLEGTTVIHQYKKMIYNDKDILYTAVTRNRKFDDLFFSNSLKDYDKESYLTQQINNTYIKPFEQTFFDQ